MTATSSDDVRPGARGWPPRTERLGVAHSVALVALCVVCGGAPPPHPVAPNPTPH